MSFDIVRGVIKNAPATDELISALNSINNIEIINGTLFLGYPLTVTDESYITVDALLISEEKGLIAFSFYKSSEDINDEQDLLYYQLNNALTKYEALRSKRELAFSPSVITFFPNDDLPEKEVGYVYANKENLIDALHDIPAFNKSLYNALCESLQKISTMKPRKKRKNVKRNDSLGNIIKKIEKEIANLDEWQKKAAFEIPEGPQRVRGLAGSGKTVVIALKAAYLHSQHPDWSIAITFYTRSLKQQLIDMITNFSYEFTGTKPDWEKLQILHAWGTDTEDGIYSIVSKKLNMIPLNFNNAMLKYGRNKAFSGICTDILNSINDEFNPIYDCILIDEAQDLPSSFFKICYKITKPPKRIVFAYDELQNLNNSNMPTIDEMFGLTNDGEPIVTLKNIENESKQDIVLPICYRNTPWALTLAHSLGFGVYRKDGLIQLFNELEVWDDIGYRIVNGELNYGKNVRLCRKSDSSPKYFMDLIKPEDAIIVNSFEDAITQYNWMANEIEKNIKYDELDPDDILVIFPDTYSAKRQYLIFREVLAKRNINSVLAGVNTDRDTFRVENSITCSNIYRAKGNESPMVYIANADYCAQGIEMIALRNTLFTAITRSRAWVRICGMGSGMDILKDEINKCISNSYEMDFRIPTLSELDKMRLIHRDRSEEEKRKIKETSEHLKNIILLVEKGEIDSNVIPELNTLINTIKNKNDLDSFYEEE